MTRRAATVAAPRPARAPPAPAYPFPIVGIGASAGGLEAFRQLLGALPADTGMAYVLVQHLDPKQESILADLLSEATAMDVSEVEGDVPILPDHVYVIPSDQDIVLASGGLKLVPRSQTGNAHMPIDSFLRSLADVHGSHGIGVILSGMASDGTLGLQAMKAEGSITFAQEPRSARHDGMPRSAIAAGCVDFVLSPQEIARELARLGRHPYLASPEPQDTADAQVVSGILAVVKQATGVDFGAYKKTTLQRRIARRMAVSQRETLEDYLRHLESDPGEVQALYQDCLISVTAFFRDPAMFEALAERVLPRLREGDSRDGPLRVWVPGCATGEEVYSIAMCLLEARADREPIPSLQIFGTDLSDRALATARAGVYLENIAKDVTPERLRRFFVRRDGQYQVSKSVREMCVFARHDLTRDPPFSRMDLISCRNVLIYLETALQERVLATFHYALVPNGFLILAPAEAVAASSRLFSAVDEKHRIFVKNASVPSPPFRFAPSARPALPHPEGAPLTGAAVRTEVPREADRMMLARYGPAGVVVDEGLNILEFRGDTDPFLEHVQGQASLSLARMIRKGLLVDLRQAIAEARRTNLPSRRDGLQIRHRDQVRRVSLEVLPIQGRVATEGCLLVLFETDKAPAPDIRPEGRPKPRTVAGGRDVEVAELTRKLADADEYLHTVLREHEAALEELQATNEEAVSSNEELQSLNEELQTAKEEIQSASEELATLNQELQDRNGQLRQSNEEIQRALDAANAIVATVPQPLLILDGDLRVERANPAFYETFRVAPQQTEGRLFYELGAAQWDKAPLRLALAEVVAKGADMAPFAMEEDFPVIGRRSMSIRAHRLQYERLSGLLLLAIEDRTEVVRGERSQQALLTLEHEARERAENADHRKDDFVATVSHELRGPLTVIAGWAHILAGTEGKVDPATMAKGLDAILRGIKAQGRLIADLFDHSRIVTGKIQLNRSPIDLVAIAEAALEGVRVAAEAKDIRIAVRGDRGTAVITGDPDRMQQVLWNLLFNAVKFTPRGGQVQVWAGRIETHVQVVVTDTGVGMKADLLPHVFERFRYGGDLRTQAGLGLGLTLVRELVELHGGTVRAESAGTGQGSRFTIALPVPGPSDESSSLAVLPEQGAARGLLEGVGVLVVADEPEGREALVRVLQHHGAQVREAASLNDAMAEMEAAAPDVLVSDLGTPGEDGCDLMRRIRRREEAAGGRLPAVAVSAGNQDGELQKARLAGFQYHLATPVVPAELVSQVARAARRLSAE